MLCVPAGLALAPTSAPALPDHLQAEPGSALGSAAVALLEETSAFRLAGRKSDKRRSVQAAVPLGVSEEELEKLWAMPRRLQDGGDFSCPVQAAR